MEKLTKRPIHQYSQEALLNALKAIREEKLCIREASRKFNVPKTTLQDRLSGRIKEGPRKMGPTTVLTTDEEKELVQWLCEIAKCGFPRKKVDLLDTVQNIIVKAKRCTPFKNNRPGERWYRSFLRRHKELSFRDAENLTVARSAITEEYIRKWFLDLKNYLNENNISDILNDPSRILNGDETSFSMCPKSGKVLAPKGWKNLYERKRGNEKETITVLLVFNADGKIVYPLVVFPYIRPPKAVVDSMPSGWFLGKSDSGWMRADVFYEYIANGLHKWLDEENITRPVLLLIDGHKSHLTCELSQFCHDNGIILYALPPNTTHILQPADVSLFKPLKTEWKNTVRTWQSKPENINSVLTKTNFCPLLKEVLDKTTTSLPGTIKKGFRKCGLYPFNPDLVDYTKCIQNRLEKLSEVITEREMAITEQELEITERVLGQLQETFLGKGITNVPDIINEIRATKLQLRNKSLIEVYEVNEAGELELIAADHTKKIQSTGPTYIFEINDSLETNQTTELHRENDLSKNETEKEYSRNSDLKKKEKEIKVLQDITLSKNCDSNTFKKHLYWPTPFKKSTKPKTESNGKPPVAAVSSDVYREFLKKKQEKKVREEEEKQRRKEMRLKRVSENKKIQLKKRKVNKVATSETTSKIKEKCGSCGSDLDSDVEDDTLKNVGCDKCPRWFHLKCTYFYGYSYDQIINREFICPFC